MKSAAVLVSLAIAGSVSVAQADNDIDLHAKSVDESGTSVKRDQSHSDKVGLTGTRTIKDNKEKVTNPPGLNNETKEQAKTVRKYGANGDISEETTTVDKDGTARSVEDKTHTAKNLTGGTTTTSTRTESVDPRGMLNQQKNTVEDKTTVSADGSTVQHTKKVNGTTVSDSTETNR